MVDFATTEMPTNHGGDVFSTVGRRKARKLFEVLGWLFVLLLIFVGLSSLFSRVGFMVDAFSQEIANPEEVFNAFDIRYVQHFLVV